MPRGKMCGMALRDGMTVGGVIDVALWCAAAEVRRVIGVCDKRDCRKPLFVQTVSGGAAYERTATVSWFTAACPNGHEVVYPNGRVKAPTVVVPMPGRRPNQRAMTGARAHLSRLSTDLADYDARRLGERAEA